MAAQLVGYRPRRLRRCTQTPSCTSPRPLREGSGYHHRTLLRRLQERQRAWRNIDGGYWIAEADPAAAHHAVTATLSARDLSWGRTRHRRPSQTHLRISAKPTGQNVATKSGRQLTELLACAHHWNARTTQRAGITHAPSATTTNQSRLSVWL